MASDTQPTLFDTWEGLLRESFERGVETGWENRKYCVDSHAHDDLSDLVSRCESLAARNV